jgi:hypothetical protein
LRQPRHVLSQVVMGLGKERNDCACIARSASNVIGRVIRVNDGKTIGVLVGERRNLVLKHRTRLN